MEATDLLLHPVTLRDYESGEKSSVLPEHLEAGPYLARLKFREARTIGSASGVLAAEALVQVDHVQEVDSRLFAQIYYVDEDAQPEGRAHNPGFSTLGQMRGDIAPSEVGAIEGYLVKPIGSLEDELEELVEEYGPVKVGVNREPIQQEQLRQLPLDPEE